jgi:hypothetical protein
MRAVARVGLIIMVLAGSAAGSAQALAAPARAAPAARAGSGARLASVARPASGPRFTPAVVLVNQPAARVCTGKTFKVGVWYQQSGGSRAYRVAVYNPRGHRIFYRHGRAPLGNWKFWRIRAWRAGTYRTVYSGHWKKPTVWTKYRAKTRSRHC